MTNWKSESSNRFLNNTSTLILSMLIMLFATSVYSQDHYCADFSIIEYDGCLLPEDPSQEYPWQIDASTNGEAYVEDCVLVLPVQENWGYIGYTRNDPSIGTSNFSRMQARVMVSEFLPTINLTNASVGFCHIRFLPGRN